MGDDVACGVNRFKHWGSVNGSFENQIRNDMMCVWMKCRGLSDILCDKMTPLRLEGRFHKIVVRPKIRGNRQ